MAQKATKIEKEKRLFTVQGWIVEGVPDYLILKQVKNWGLTLRQARRYLSEAYDLWRKDQQIEIFSRRDSRIAELQQDIRNMDQKFKNTPAGLRIMLAYKKELSKLEDLYPAKRMLHGSDPDNPLEIKTALQAIEIIRVEK